jgi:uncharacterized protein YxjI
MGKMNKIGKLLLVLAIFPFLQISIQNPKVEVWQQNLATLSTVATIDAEPNFIVHSSTNITLYSPLVAINVVWDGVKRYDRLLDNTAPYPWLAQPISYWCKWKVDWYKGTSPKEPYVSLVEDSVTFLPPIKNETGVYLIVNSTMNDGSIFTIIYKILNVDGKLKWDLKFKASNAWTTKYRFTYEYFTLPCEKKTISTVKQIVFTYSPSYNVTFFYDDVNEAIYTVSEDWDSTNHKHYFYIDLGNFSNLQTKEIDPSVVGTTTTTTATWYPFQRKSFYANGRFWVFYSDGTNMVYKTSTDGLTWSQVNIVRPCTSGSYFSIWFDETYLHYAYAATTVNTPLYYRRGLPNSDGSITWSTENEVAIPTIYNRVYYPFVSVDSNGYPWIGYIDRTGANYYPYVVKGSANDGTFGTPTITQLSTTRSINWRVSIIPLTEGKMLAIYARNGQTIRAKRWDGSSWGSEKATTSSIAYGYSFSAVAQGDDVHLVFLTTTYNIIYTKYTYSSDSFGPETILISGATSTSAPVISIDASTKNLYVFAATKTTGTPSGWIANHIYYKIYFTSSGSWSDWIDWINESSEILYSADRLTCFYQSYESKIGLVYMTRTTSPYNVKFAFLFIQYKLNLRIKDYDLIDNIQNARVYITNATGTYSKLSDVNGWANFTSYGNTNVKVEYYGFWINGTFTINVDSDKTIDVKCNLYDVTFNIKDNNNRGYLVGANVTIFNSTNKIEKNKICSGITDSNGQVTLMNLPSNTLNIVVYDGAPSPSIIGEVGKLISYDGQIENIICNSWATSNNFFSIYVHIAAI